MKFTTGDKVHYHSGDWQFFGTVTAILENSICPCYRINVERMEKNNCQFSITQFEFELERISQETTVQDIPIWEQLQNNYLKTQETLQSNETVLTDIPTVSLPDPVNISVSHKKRGKAPSPSKPETGKDEPAIKISTWDKHLDSYMKGERSNVISVWMYQNRKQYNEGNLKESRLNKLKEIDFPLDVHPRKRAKRATKKQPTESTDIWHKQLRQWKSGDDRPSLQQWRQTNVKRYVAGKLSEDKIRKLKEVGILK